MTFTPPEYTKFRASTLNLDDHYSKLLKRYRIDNSNNDAPSSSKDASSSSAQQRAFELLIAKTNQVLSCKSDRDDQREVFILLVNELRQINKEDKSKVEEGTQFLLGALLHRYFRLIKHYEDFNAWARYTYFAVSEVTECRLFMAIRKALGLPDLKEIELLKQSERDKVKSSDLDKLKKRSLLLKIDNKTFLDYDLDILDEVTIVTALEVFRDNMFLKNEKKITRYMKYPHLAKDENFKPYLRDIIDEHTERGAPFLKRFKAISFVQSLVKQLDEDRLQIEKDLQAWSKALTKDHRDFAKLKTLLKDDESKDDNERNKAWVREHLNQHVSSEFSRKKILELLSSGRMQDNLDKMDHLKFLQEMQATYDYTCSYTLLGGYTLLLHHESALDDDLLFAIKKALEIKSDDEELTKQDKLDSFVEFFKKYLGDKPGVELDWTFFCGKGEKDSLIARVEKEITKLPAQRESAELVY